MNLLENLTPQQLAARGFAWDVNPWVVATTFTVHKVNIDQMKERKHDGKIEAVG